MILYMDREDVPDLENISEDVLWWCIRKAEAVNGRYRRLRDYYLGKHLRPRGDDEIRVTANYAKYVVDTVLGYYLGQSVKYDANRKREKQSDQRVVPDTDSGQDEQEREQDEIIDISPLVDCYDRQRISRIDLEIGRTMGIMGDCLELCYASSD